MVFKLNFTFQIYKNAIQIFQKTRGMIRYLNSGKDITLLITLILTYSRLEFLILGYCLKN